MKNRAFASKVKELRMLKGLSQEELAYRAKLSLRTVQRIESNETEPRGHTLQQLSAALDILTQELVVLNGMVNKRWWVLFNMSALSFMVFPILGPLLPFMLWRTNNDKLKGREDAVRKLINFEIGWCIVQFLIFTTVLVCKIYHLPVFGNWIAYLFGGLYAVNFLFIIFNATRIFLPDGK
ncbi:MAG: helix-turn-helix domain-containing protein [Sphingobacteriaceae bacterium]|nr:MAG: helix-turn-helix domain-containing protein [Sphingobacteriaceae bacterium]